MGIHQANIMGKMTAFALGKYDFVTEMPPRNIQLQISVNGKEWLTDDAQLVFRYRTCNWLKRLFFARNKPFIHILYV